MAFSDRATATLLLAIVLATAAPASAQSSPEALQAAQGLYDAALKEIEKKSYESGCKKLEEAARLVPEGVGVKLTLAECYEAWGKLASARAAFEVAEAAARTAGQADRQKLARDRADSLVPRLARLTLTVSPALSATPGLIVERDGKPVDSALWGVPIPVDRGRHTVVVTAPGRARTEKTVEIAEDGANLSFEVPTPSLAGAAAPDSTTSPSAAPTGDSAPPPPDAPTSGRKIAGIAVAAAGVLGLVAGGVAGAIAIGKQGDAKKGCDPDGWVCDDETYAGFVRESLTAGNWSTALLVGGGVAAAGGLVLWLTAPGAESQKATTGAGKTPRAAPGPSQMSLRIGPQVIRLEGRF